MKSDQPGNRIARRSLAIALWLLLTGLSYRLSPEVSSTNALRDVLGLSLASSVALLIFGVSRRIAAGRIGSRDLVAALIALAVPLTAVLWVGSRTEPVATLLPIVATAPVGITWLIAILSRRPVSEVPVMNAAAHGVSSIPADSVTVLVEGQDRRLVPHEPFTPTVCLHDSESDDQYESDLEVPESPALTQWLTRSLTSDGDIIEGGVRVDFDAGQRDAIVHVPFCPPFQGVPQVTTEDLDGADLEIRVAAVFLFGLRLTVRRPSGQKVQQSGMCRVGFVVFHAAAQRVA